MSTEQQVFEGPGLQLPNPSNLGVSGSLVPFGKKQDDSPSVVVAKNAGMMKSLVSKDIAFICL